MSLLDDTRRLAEMEPESGEDFDLCAFCETEDLRGGHETDCPWLAMPRIVAALKAAERLVAVWQETYEAGERRMRVSWAEAAALPSVASFAAEELAARQALVAALKEPEH